MYLFHAVKCSKLIFLASLFFAITSNAFSSPKTLPLIHGMNESRDCFFGIKVKYNASSEMPESVDQPTTLQLLELCTYHSSKLVKRDHQLRFITQAGYSKEYECQMLATWIDITTLEGVTLCTIKSDDNIFPHFEDSDTWDTLLLGNNKSPLSEMNMSPFDTEKLIRYNNMLLAASSQCEALEERGSVINVSETLCENKDLYPNVDRSEEYCGTIYRELNGAALLYTLDSEKLYTIVFTESIKGHLSSIESVTEWLKSADVLEMTFPRRLPLAEYDELSFDEDDISYKQQRINGFNNKRKRRNPQQSRYTQKQLLVY